MYDNSNTEKKTSKITEIAAIIGVIVSVLIAGTTLFNYSSNLPLWWFQLTFIALIILLFSIPIMILYQPINAKIEKEIAKRKRNAISRKYASDLKDLVRSSDNFRNSTKSIFDMLGSRYKPKMQNKIATYAFDNFGMGKISNEVQSILYEIDTSDKTYNELHLIMEHFKLVLDEYDRGLTTLAVIAHEIMSNPDEQIPKDIVDSYENLREKYNVFLYKVNDFSHKINKETGRNDFPEHLEPWGTW
jgi:hypothetical protein